NKAESSFKMAERGRMYPSMVTKGGKRVEPTAEFELVNESNQALTWADVGINHKATLQYDSNGKLKKAIVHGLEEKPIYLVHGTLKTWDHYAFFFTAAQEMPYLYTDNYREGSPLPELIAMAIRSADGYYEEYAIYMQIPPNDQGEECPYFYGPLPLQFVRFHVIE
ncbi:MAG: hypothetical protein IJS52_11010, partial [Bacilli bacterium]|nr:hypothetical protein [Bacilli bacterium]